MEQTAGERLILTLATPDGFSVAFSLARDELAAMAAAETAQESRPDTASPARVVN